MEEMKTQELNERCVDYLHYGLPKSKLKSVFLSARAPYVGATKACVSADVNGVIIRSGVNIADKRPGPHSLRHSLASTMLDNGMMLPVIS